MRKKKNKTPDIKKVLQKAWAIIVPLSRIVAPYIIPIAVMGLGLAAPNLMLDSLGKKAASTPAEIKKNDTLNVRILNNPEGYLSTNKPPDTSYHKPDTIKVNTINTSSTARKDTPIQAAIVVTTIKSDELEKSWRSKHNLTIGVSKYFWWIFIAFTLFTFAIYLFYFFEPRLSLQMQKDRDPAELEYLFNKYDEDIMKLGVPRKIKRFSNKVRFQYHMLKDQNIMKQTGAGNLFMKTLLSIELERRSINDRLAMILEDSDPEKRKQALNATQIVNPTHRSFADFKAMIKSHFKREETTKEIDENTPLMNELYNINKNMIV